MGVIFILMSLLLLVYLCFKQVPIFIASFIAGIFLLIMSKMNPVVFMTDNYIQGLAGYFGKFFFIFILGSIFGKLTEISGAADSIAKGVIEKVGSKFVIPSIILAGAVLTYGGVSVFVAMFALYPMMVSMFEKADIPRNFIPATYFAGAGTFTGMMPGSPQIQNIIPGSYLGTAPTAALVPGLMTAGFEAILVFAYMTWAVKMAQSKGYGFISNGRDNELIEMNKGKELPSFILSIVPLLVILITLNIFNIISFYDWIILDFARMDVIKEILRYN